MGRKLAHIICFPVLQGDAMNLKRGLSFGATISVEKSPLLACIQDRVAAKDGDHFATVYGVWMRPTDNQTEWAQSGSRGFRGLFLIQTAI